MAFISSSTDHSQNTGTRLQVRLAARARQIVLEAIQRRRISTGIGHLSERHLRDIGLTRNDVSSIARLPLPFSAAHDFSETARSRAGNW